MGGPQPSNLGWGLPLGCTMCYRGLPWPTVALTVVGVQQPRTQACQAPHPTLLGVLLFRVRTLWSFSVLAHLLLHKHHLISTQACSCQSSTAGTDMDAALPPSLTPHRTLPIDLRDM